MTALLSIWHTDDLRSMGLVVPFVSFALILRSWRQIGWQADGSWWGFAVIAAAAALMFLHDETLLTITVNKDWLVPIPPLPFVAVAYAAGMVLLFGGMRLLRAAWFGLLFMGMVIPVPHTFSRAIDLPLQHASATVARAFAHALGQQLTQDKLRLMFTPDFGMFIAPGCNGIRGAVTLGLAAVVVSYVYRFRWFIYAPIVVGAVLLGYLFNFLRLCLLVIYYKIALPYPWLQQRATGADFLIGGALFICALTVFFTVANRLRNDPADTEPAPPLPVAAATVSASPLLLRALAVFVMAGIFGYDVYHIHVAEAKVRAAAPEQVSLPRQLGPYMLLRMWNDTNPDGGIVYMWGEYAIPGEGGPSVDLGISPRLDVHDAEICHLARGESPNFHSQLEVADQGSRIDLTLSSYNNGVSQWLEASTVCDAGTCHQFSKNSTHVAIVYALPHRGTPLATNVTRPVPVLLRLDSADARSPDALVRPQLVLRLQTFLQSFSLQQVAQQYSRR